MQNFILFKNSKIAFYDVGKGVAVVLLHGFLEDSTMWEKVVPEMSKKNRVICIDLLGHGNTENLGYLHSMELMAESVEEVLKALKIRRCFLVGHSMGGYVSLAFAVRNIQKIKGICLMNSTSLADTEERQKIRSRGIEMAQNNYESLVRMSFMNLFTKEGISKFKPQIDAALQSALQISVQSYIACQEGMKQRKKYSKLLANNHFKKVIIVGEKDTVLSVKNIEKEAISTNSELRVFNGGHMSHIENEQELITELLGFLK